jgi:hypothetical protein
MEKQKDADQKETTRSKTPAEILAEEFLKTVESTLKKAEKETWLHPTHEHPYNKSK